MKDTILVIGASGQIGTELVSTLRNTYGNANVIASDIRSLKSDDNIQSGPFEVLDIMDKELLFEIVKKYQVTQVYLLAALLSATAEQNIELKEATRRWQAQFIGEETKTPNKEWEDYKYHISCRPHW